MKKHLTKVAIFLLAGAVVNVGVACTCAMFAPLNEITPLQIEQRVSGHWFPFFWTCRRATGVGSDQIAFTAGPFAPRHAITLQSADAAAMLPRWIDVPSHRSWIFQETLLWTAAGWPMRCLEAHCLEEDLRWTYITKRPMTRAQSALLAKKGLLLRAPAWKDAIVIEDQTVGGPFGAKVIPTRPIASGMAANTLLYAVILWLLCLLRRPLGLRRLIRIKRGLCPMCAYPMGESAVCTECGKDLPKRVRPAT